MIAIGHNGGPSSDIDTDDVKMSWIKLDIADFKRGIANLDYETRGFYITILVEMYDSKGRLPNDLYLLGKRLGTTARVVKRVLDVLVSQGKVYVSGDWLRNRRCDEEREKLIAEYCKRHVAAVKREAARRSHAQATEEVSPKFGGSFGEVSAKQSANPDKFDQSSAETIQKSQIKTTEQALGLWQTSDQSCAHNLEKKKKEEEKNTPLPPKGGDEGRRARKPKSDFSQTELMATDAAIDAWNQTARSLGLAVVESRTPQRRRRLLARLSDIGGPPAFAVALSAIHSVPFLMGRVPPKPGQEPFKLDIEKLLQTDGNLGDVLAKLIDKAHAQPSSMGTGSKPWDRWSAAEWKAQIAKHANGIWPADRLGHPPGSKLCAVPDAVVTEERLTERYTPNGISREKH